MSHNNYTPLAEPIAISEQTWPEGTIPLVSTSTATYNHETYIRDCLDGILMQKTTFPVRVCIFEDASTDRTAEIVKEYADKYPGLIFAFCQKENTYGKGEVRRKAREPYEKARSVAKYIALCEGDDYWIDPLKLQKQVEFLEENEEYSLCFHNATVIYEDKRKRGLSFDIETREYSGEEILKKWTIPTASVVFRTSMYEPVSHPDFIYGDIILFLSLAMRGRVFGMEEVMSIYRKHESSLTSLKNRSIKQVENFIKHHKAIRVSFNGRYEEVEREILSQNYLGLSKMQLRKFKLSFLKSIFNSYKTAPELFLRNLLRSYLKIKY